MTSMTDSTAWGNVGIAIMMIHQWSTSTESIRVYDLPGLAFSISSAATSGTLASFAMYLSSPGLTTLQALAGIQDSSCSSWASPFGRVYLSDILVRAQRCQNNEGGGSTRWINYLVDELTTGTIPTHLCFPSPLLKSPLLFQSWHRLHDYLERSDLHCAMSWRVLLR